MTKQEDQTFLDGAVAAIRDRLAGTPATSELEEIQLQMSALDQWAILAGIKNASEDHDTVHMADEHHVHKPATVE
jgi:hypothetical protein